MSLSARERGLKFVNEEGKYWYVWSLSARERGLKSLFRAAQTYRGAVALCTRAWIEISPRWLSDLKQSSLSARERGLKSETNALPNCAMPRSLFARERGLKCKSSVVLQRNYRSLSAQLGLENDRFKKIAKEIKVFAWKGDNIQDTWALMLTAKGLPATNEGLCLSVEAESTEQIYYVLKNLLDEPVISPEALAEYVKNKQQGKWDWLLPDDLLNKNYASANLDVVNALHVLRKLLE